MIVNSQSKATPLKSTIVCLSFMSILPTFFINTDTIRPL